MERTTRSLVAFLVAGLWINGSEFLRNEILLKAAWREHYRSLGIVFPAAPRNAAVWVLWGFLFAAAITLLSSRFSLARTTLLAWLLGFVLMWLVIGNLGVLPSGLLAYAVPLSLLETFVAAWLVRRLGGVR